MTVPPQFPATSRLLRGFCVGGGPLVLLTLVLSRIHGYLWATAVILTAALTIFALALIVAVRWVAGRVWQIDLASVFFAITLIAAYLGVARWLVSADKHVTAGLLLMLSLLAMASPFVVLLGDNLLALAAWAIWRPGTQHWLNCLRPRRKGRARTTQESFSDRN